MAREHEARVELEQVRHVGPHRQAIQSFAARGQTAREVLVEGRHQGQAEAGDGLQLRGLLPGGLLEDAALGAIQQAHHIPGDAIQEHGVVPLARGVDVPQVLEAEEVCHLARRDEAGGAGFAGEEGQAAEGDGVKLGTIRQSLLQAVAATVSLPRGTALWAARGSRRGLPVPPGPGGAGREAQDEDRADGTESHGASRRGEKEPPAA